MSKGASVSQDRVELARLLRENFEIVAFALERESSCGSTRNRGAILCRRRSFTIGLWTILSISAWRLRPPTSAYRSLINASETPKFSGNDYVALLHEGGKHCPPLNVHMPRTALGAFLPPQDDHRIGNTLVLRHKRRTVKEIWRCFLSGHFEPPFPHRISGRQTFRCLLLTFDHMPRVYRTAKSRNVNATLVEGASTRVRTRCTT